MKKIKTTISFTPVQSVLDLAKSSDPGKAGYGARIIIDGVEAATIESGPNARSITIEAPEGSQAVVILAARDRLGIWGPATPFEFKVANSVPPRRPTELHVSHVESALASTSEPVNLKVTDEGAAYNVSCKGVAGIKDGAIGTVAGYDSIQNAVIAYFPDSAMEGNTESKLTRHEMKFTADCPIDQVQIISPDQSTISVSEYVGILTKLAAQA